MIWTDSRCVLWMIGEMSNGNWIRTYYFFLVFSIVIKAASAPPWGGGPVHLETCLMLWLTHRASFLITIRVHDSQVPIFFTPRETEQMQEKGLKKSIKRGTRQD